MKTAVLILCVMLGASSAASAADLVWIWRFDGSLQCAMANGRSLQDGAEIIQQAGATVVSARKVDVLPALGKFCGAPTGSANSYEISSSDWAAIKSKFGDGAAFARESSSGP